MQTQLWQRDIQYSKTLLGLCQSQQIWFVLMQYNALIHSKCQILTAMSEISIESTFKTSLFGLAATFSRSVFLVRLEQIRFLTNLFPYLFESSQKFAGASRDPPEKQAPMCTLHSFPHNIDHCLTYARSEFEGMFEKSPAEANGYLSDPEKYVATVRASSDSAARDQLEKVVAALADERCSNFEECVAWARQIFQVFLDFIQCMLRILNSEVLLFVLSWQSLLGLLYGGRASLSL